MAEPIAYLNGQNVPNSQCVLPVYDAGTESGKKYSLENEASDPLEKIARLTETVAGSVDYVDGMVGGNSIATVRFKRLK